MFRNSRSRVAATALAAAVVLSMALPAGAFAALEDGWRATSETNPYVGNDDTTKVNSTWRWGWGNKPVINLNFVEIPEDDTKGELKQTDGFIYEFHQVDTSGGTDTVPLWGAPTTFLSSDPVGSLINQNFNITAANLREGWSSYAGANAFGEGMYRVSILFYNQFRIEDPAAVDSVPFGYDVTPPRPVEDLTSTVGALGQGDGWTEVSWRDMRWTSQAYDDLAGVGGFEVSIDSSPVAFAKNVSPNGAYEPYGQALIDFAGAAPEYRNQLSNVTLEEIPAGKHTIGITTVDRATNRSTMATVSAWVDNDTPALVITSPQSGATLGKSAKFSVIATDAAGISSVAYYIDGILVGTSTSAPFSLSQDLSAFSNGTHTLKAVATDMIGATAGVWTMPHTATESVSFKIDRTAPSISFVSAGSNPFYPRKRDGYKDNFTVKFKTNEAGTAKLTIKNSAGTTVRTVSKSVGSGSQSIAWDGKYTSGSVKSGTFSYRLTVTDKAGNVSSATGTRKVTIKFYELVKTSSNTVKVISR